MSGVYQCPNCGFSKCVCLGQEIEELSDERRAEINRALAEFMGVMPQHDFSQFGDKCYWCKCHFSPANAASRCKWAGRDLPDYTSESSPRSLLSDVEKRVIEKFGAIVYGKTLGISIPGLRNNDSILDLGCHALAMGAVVSAEQRCLAIEAVIKEANSGQA